VAQLKLEPSLERRLERARPTFTGIAAPWASALAKDEPLSALEQRLAAARGVAARQAVDLPALPPQATRFFSGARLASHRQARGRFEARARAARRRRSARVAALARQRQRLRESQRAALNELLGPPGSPAPEAELLLRVEASLRVDAPDRAARLAQRLLARRPGHAWASYLLRHARQRQGRRRQAPAAFLGVVCPAAALRVNCPPRQPPHALAAEAWLRIGWLHFGARDYRGAVAALERAARLAPVGRVRRLARAHLAWSRYRAGQLAAAARGFDALAGEAVAPKTRRAALGFLALIFAREDWDGDGKPDADAGLPRLERFYGGRHAEDQVREVYRRTAAALAALWRYHRSAPILGQLVARWPLHPTTPSVHRRLISALDRQRKFGRSSAELLRHLRVYARGAPWWTRNRPGPAAREHLRRMERQHLRFAAGRHRVKAMLSWSTFTFIGCEERCEPFMGDFEQAARLYRRWLTRFPGHRFARQNRYKMVECLLHAGRPEEAARELAPLLRVGGRLGRRARRLAGNIRQAKHRRWAPPRPDLQGLKCAP